MKLGIGIKLAVLVTALVCVTGLVLVRYVVRPQASEIVTSHEKVDLRDETRLRAWEMMSQIYALRRVVTGIGGDLSKRADQATIEQLKPAAAELCEDSVNSHSNLLRVEIRLPEGEQLQRVRAGSEQSKPLDAAAEKVLQGLRSTRPGREIDMVSEIDQLELDGEPITLVWSGMRVVTESHEIYVLAAMDLNAPLTRKFQDRSPLGTMSASPRHLCFLVNDLSDAHRLIHPDPRQKGVLESEFLLEHFDSLNQLPKDPDAGNLPVISSGMVKAPLARTLWFRQSKPYSDELFANSNDQLLAQFPSAQLPRGGRIGGLSFGVRNVRLLAASEEDLASMSEAVEKYLEREYDLPVRWQPKVECKNCLIHFVLFPVRSAERDGKNRRYYGLAQAVFEEELNADVANELTAALRWPAVWLVGGVAFVGFISSLLFTRPLKKITATAQKVASRKIDADPHSEQWKREIDEIVSGLPLGRRDEIGDLARGFERMITEVQAQGKDLREREARLRMIVDSAAEGIVTAFDKLSAESDSLSMVPRIPRVSDDGVVNQFNLAAKRMFGYEASELRGESVRRLIAPAYHKKLESCLHVLAQDDSSRPSVTIEAVGVRKDGSQFPLELAVSSGMLDERRVFTFIVRDITERKQAEQRIQQMNDDLTQLNAELDQRVQRRTAELEKANKELKVARDKARDLAKAKDAFLASVSHELRNPLNQVTGFCQLLELTDLDEGQRGDLEKIRQAAKRLLTLINDILDYQKIIMGGITLEPEQLQVVDLLNEVRNATEFQAQENGNRLEFQTSDDAGTLFADKHRVLQILVNLVSNACKFTSEGVVTVRASRRGDVGQQWIELSVEDTGRGMKPEEKAKLFQPFIKLASKKGNKAGTGLGLVIAKGFCELMKGTITADSEFRKGSTFTIRLPASQTDSLPADLRTATPVEKSRPDAQVEDEFVSPFNTVNDTLRKAGQSIHSAAAGGALDNRTVLVIDDDAGVREMMQRYLSVRGFHVITAEGGLEGLERARQIKPAVVTLDAMMPGLDGWAVLAALKTDPETRKIPVIMVTITDDEEKGKKLGAEEFLSKPIDWDRLSSVLADYTGEKRDRSILVVDDDEQTREVLHRFLDRDGWTVLEAEDGSSALELLAVEQPAAIILDLIMPGMDGFEFIAQYSQLAEWLSIPVIVLTSKEPTQEELDKLEGLVVRVLRKGEFSTERLLEEIHRRVDMHIKTDSVESTGA